MSGKRILVVDDHDTVRWAVSEELVRAGFEVDLASSSEEACEALDNKEYDVILSDLVMPGEVNGLGFGEIMREAKTNAIRIAMSSLQAEEESLAAGYSYFLCKPFSPDELIRTINTAMQLPN